jgi:hypothetical protein
VPLIVESWLHRAARTHPGHVALRADDGALTYAELDAAATLATLTPQTTGSFA